jgi:hypothetical protein
MSLLEGKDQQPKPSFLGCSAHIWQQLEKSNSFSLRRPCYSILRKLPYCHLLIWWFDGKPISSLSVKVLLHPTLRKLSDKVHGLPPRKIASAYWVDEFGKTDFINNKPSVTGCE